MITHYLMVGTPKDIKYKQSNYHLMSIQHKHILKLLLLGKQLHLGKKDLSYSYYSTLNKILVHKISMCYLLSKLYNFRCIDIYSKLHYYYKNMENSWCIEWMLNTEYTRLQYKYNLGLLRHKMKLSIGLVHNQSYIKSIWPGFDYIRYNYFWDCNYFVGNFRQIASWNHYRIVHRNY